MLEESVWELKFVKHQDIKHFTKKLINSVFRSVAGKESKKKSNTFSPDSSFFFIEGIRA